MRANMRSNFLIDLYVLSEVRKYLTEKYYVILTFGNNYFLYLFPQKHLFETRLVSFKID